MKQTGNNYQKPKLLSSDDLFTIEIWLSDLRQYRLVRDCKYDQKNKTFTQIDDLTEFNLYEIYEWTRQN